MRNTNIVSGFLIAACTAAILVLVTMQARVALQPQLSISFSPPPVAYGYAFRNVFITGTVYNNDGVTPVGANRVVAVTFDGGAIRGTGATTSTGYYAISNLSHSGGGVVVTAFLQDMTEDAVTVTTLSGGDLRQFHLYRNYLIARADSGSYPLTNTHLDTGDNNGDSDITAIYRSLGTKASTQSGKGLFVWAEDTYKPGGNVTSGSGVTIAGTMQPEANTVTLSGTWLKKTSGTFTYATSTVVMNGTYQTVSGSTTFKNFTKSVSSADTLRFNAGSTQTFTGTLLLQGAESNRLFIRSTGTGSQWNLNPQSTRTVKFLTVKDSRNTNASIINCTTGCLDGGNDLGWNFGTFSIRGTVYSDKGTTAIGANRIVAAAMNGGPRSGTAATTSTGFYLIENLQYTGGLVLSVFLDNGAEKAVTTTILSSTGLTGYHLYKDNLIVRADSGSTALTNTHLATADNTADSDLLAVFHAGADASLSTGSGRTVFVWTGDTYQPGGRVKTHDLDVRGTMTLGTNGLVASGSVLVSGTLTTSTGILLTSVSRETLAMTGVTLQTITVDNGLWGYWRMDEGTGSVVRDSSIYAYSGAIAGIDYASSSGWVLGSTGTKLFYNPASLLFDGSTDFVNIGSKINPDDRQDFTITAWVNRSSFSGKHTIVAKKSGSGVSAAGYMLWIDDATDTLQFAASDGTDDYTLRSTSTFNAAGWRHVAVVWDENSAAGTELYVNGVADNATDTGTIGSVNDLSNSVSLRIGSESDAERSFHGRIDDVRIYRRALDPSEILALAQGNKATGSGTYTLGSALDINGNLQIFGGTIDVSAANKTINLAGNMNIQGGFTKGSGTVILDGTNQTLSGSTFLNALRKIITSSATLFFDFTSRQSVSGSLVLQGANSSTKLSIRSTKSGSLARLVLDTLGNQTLQYLNVKDSTASGGAVLACATSCTDSGHNFRWTFACGDGVVSVGESCDDGGTTAGDGCSATCTAESGYTCTGSPSTCTTSCGDGIIAGTESCDNGGSNSNAADAACRTDCTSRRCGDGIRDTGEGCDDGNTNNNDECLNSCLLNTAGGGGNGSTSSSNSSYYKRPPPPLGCGNGVKEIAKGEECDEGRFNDLGTCSYDCKLRYCGDGEITVVTGEECEPTPSAGPNGERLYQVETCGKICTAPDASGQGGCKVNYLRPCESEENAGAGGGDSGDIAFPPRSDLPIDVFLPPEEGGWDQDGFIQCGNGILEVGEQCDDGNLIDGDGCTSGCAAEGYTVAICGDGVLMEGEDCDDGNNLDGDGCSAICESTSSSALCGNGTVDDGEECDNAEQNSDEAPGACRRSCRSPSCGDAVIDPGEQCDDGVQNSAVFPDRCRTDCTLSRCGDGVRDSGEACDGGLGCNSTCRYAAPATARCGDGFVDTFEQCDDGNILSGDGCSASCKVEHARASSSASSTASLDADIVLVNPTEIAVALRFLPDPDPCARITASGEDTDALRIRTLAAEKHIPIVKHVDLARHLRAHVPVGSIVTGVRCGDINLFKPGAIVRSASSSSSSTAPMPVPVYAPIAAYLPAQSHAPAGDTGPGAIALVGAGAAGALGWMHRKRASHSERAPL
jgi:cysteine-rich repeat protein